MTQATPTAVDQDGPSVSRRTLMLIFYLCVPVLLATISGLRSPLGSVPASIVFWVSQSVPAWLALALASEGWHRLLRPWRPPLIVILVLGAVFGGLLANLFQSATMQTEADFLFGVAIPYVLPRPTLTREFAMLIGRLLMGPFLMWAAVNYFYDRVLGIPRYRYAEPLQAVTPPVQGGPLWGRLPADLGRDLLALRAQEHYVAVTTAKGSAMILCRFSDALAAVAHLDGLCVHRSHWIARRAISSMAPERGGYRLSLRDGGSARVSQSRKLMFDHWLSGAEVIAEAS